MGDRALIVCHSNRQEFSPAVYTHWHGSAVGSVLDEAQTIMRQRDVAYAAARICGVFHSRNISPLGLGLMAGPKSWKEATSPDYSHGDAGVFLVDVDTGLVECFNGYGFDDTKDENGNNAMTRQLTLYQK